MASIRIDVRTDVKRAVAEFSAMASDIKDKATYRALNRALDKVATETGREVRKIYNVKASAVRNALRKTKATSKSLSARMLVEGARLGLIEFDARWRRGMPIGASVKIKVAGGRKNVQGAFIATNRHTGYTGVFRRTGRTRMPIRNLRSISIPQAIMNKLVLAALETVAVETFNKNFEQQVRYLSGSV